MSTVKESSIFLVALKVGAYPGNGGLNEFMGVSKNPWRRSLARVRGLRRRPPPWTPRDRLRSLGPRLLDLRPRKRGRGR